MLSRQFKIKFDKKEWTIKKTRHLYEKRVSTHRFNRGEFLDDTRYKEIFRLALINGLSSFRNKGLVVVTVPNFNNSYYCILCELDECNLITVISVWVEKNSWWKPFIKVRNRINILRGYFVKRMNKSEIMNKEFDKVSNEIELTGEDSDFKYAMNSMSDFERKMKYYN